MTTRLAEPAPAIEQDGALELDRREAMRILFTNTGARDYTFTALGSLALIFLFMMDWQSDVGGLLTVFIGVCGVLLRWPPAPVLVLVLLTYFLWTPSGIPGEGSPSFGSRDGFDLTDAIFVMAVASYVISQYRILCLVQQAIFPESEARGSDDPAVRRPVVNIAPTEAIVMLAATVASVVAAELIWWFLSRVVVVPGDAVPFRISHTYLPDGRFEWRGTPGRLYVVLGLLFFVTAIGRVVFSYWRLRSMGPAEAAMILVDDSWRETHRERSRLEKWRAWGRQRARGKASPRDTESKP